ncbi:MAG: DUF5688 family protein [bacterium]|nr:DUF5688 family protein [bacterium]
MEKGEAMETLETWKEELRRQLVEKAEWNLKEENIRFYEDGFQAGDDREEQELIRSTNIRYYKIESDVLKGNYLVLFLQKQESQMKTVCRFSLDYLFALYQKDGWERVWKEIQENITMSNRADRAGVLEQMHAYETAEEHLMIRPLNFTDNRYDLKESVYRQIGDMALVLYIKISDDKEQGLMTAKLPRHVFEEWGQNFDTVWENAMLNTYSMAQPRMYMTPHETTNPPYSKGAFMALGSSMQKIWHSQVPTVTTTRQTNGAIAMFYPGVRERIAEMTGGSYYVAFTSIHEARIHCEGSMSPRQILRSLKDVNHAFDKSEILSRKVYFYDAKKKTFEAMEL